MHYEMGQLIKKASEDLDRKTVFIASGDLSHKMKEEGPYGFAEEGPKYDDMIMEVCGNADFIKLFDFDENFCDRAAECGHRSFIMMAGALDGLELKTEKMSHEATFGVGYGICSYEVIGTDNSRHFLNKWKEIRRQKIDTMRNNEDIYVRIARSSIENYIKAEIRINKEDIKNDFSEEIPNELFMTKAGAFVSLHKDGQLRGCIGTILPCCENLAEEILHNAISAASDDPRFSPVKKEELEYLEISVDVLSAPEPIKDKNMLDVKRYGVIVTSGRKRGLLLPDLDGVDTVDAQIDIAKRKAGISDDEEISLERFEVVRHL